MAQDNEYARIDATIVAPISTAPAQLDDDPFGVTPLRATIGHTALKLIKAGPRARRRAV